MNSSQVWMLVCVLLSAVTSQCSSQDPETPGTPQSDPVQRISRQKRSFLSFPNKTSLTVTLDLMWPVNYMPKAPTFFNIHLPFRYWVPTYDQLFAAYGKEEYSDETSNENSIGYYRKYHDEEMERANRERRYVYKHIESMFSNFGWDGLACLQRAICEIAGAPMFHNDLFGNILNLLLTPPQAQKNNHLSDGQSDKKEDTCVGCELMDEPYKDEYMTAYQHGKENSCLDKYESACPISIFSMLHF